MNRPLHCAKTWQLTQACTWLERERARLQAQLIACAHAAPATPSEEQLLASDPQAVMRDSLQHLAPAPRQRTPRSPLTLPALAQRSHPTVRTEARRSAVPQGEGHQAEMLCTQQTPLRCTHVVSEPTPSRMG